MIKIKAEKCSIDDGPSRVHRWKLGISSEPRIVYKRELVTFLASGGFHSRSLSVVVLILNVHTTHNTSNSSECTEKWWEWRAAYAPGRKADTDKWIFLEIQSTRPGQSCENRLSKQLFMICLKQTLMGKREGDASRFSCFGFVGRRTSRRQRRRWLAESTSISNPTSRSEWWISVVGFNVAAFSLTSFHHVS